MNFRCIYEAFVSGSKGHFNIVIFSSVGPVQAFFYAEGLTDLINNVNFNQKCKIY